MKDRVLRRARQQWLICEEVLSQDISRVSGEDVRTCGAFSAFGTAANSCLDVQEVTEGT